MTRYIGLDVHKRFIEVCMIDAAGKVLFRGQVVCEKRQLESFCRTRFKKTDQAALEATGNTWSVVAIVQPFLEKVVVSNPLKTKAIAEAKIKTDKVDALVLAQLLRCDYLPLVWQPDAETQAVPWADDAPHRPNDASLADQEPHPVFIGPLVVVSALQSAVDQDRHGVVEIHHSQSACPRATGDGERLPPIGFSGSGTRAPGPEVGRRGVQ